MMVYKDIAKMNYRECIQALKASKVVSALRRTVTVDDTSSLKVLRPGESHLLLQYSYDENAELLVLTERVNCNSDSDIDSIRSGIEQLSIEGYYLTIDVSDFKQYLDINLVHKDVYENALELYGGKDLEEEDI